MALRIGVREGFRTIIRSRSLFILSLLVAAISFYLLSIFGLVTLNLYKMANLLDEKIEIIAFLEERADIQWLKNSIKKINGVQEVVYVSADAALKQLQEEVSETKEIVRVFEDNPLPASIRIKLEPQYRNTKGLEEISKKVLLLKGVKDTIYGGELVEQLKKITNIMLFFDIGLLIIITLSVIFVIFQTIKLTIFAHATEIEIMKLVGATDTFITIPFVFQGLIQGILGGIIAFILLVITVRIASSFFNIPFFPRPLFFLGSILFGMVFGIIGSSIALRRFLK
uniref:Cell division protein FtsX n=1 Tax=candidate division WOR-3 bacterium TaxID=2052148 RepID=A0A7V0Z782_UNCW3